MHKARSNRKANEKARALRAARQKPLPLAEQEKRADENRLRRAIINTSLGYRNPPRYDQQPTPRHAVRPDPIGELSVLGVIDFLRILAGINRHTRKAA